MANKYALLVGVDRYSVLEEKYQLAGCVNDARLVNQTLIHQFNFPAANIVELYDADASRENILVQMNHLVDVAEQGDVVVFHFSGHGSRRTTTNSEKAGGKDGTIMPSDSGRDPNPNRDIVDDEIHEWLERLTAKTNNVTLTFDCCHSGTITRDVFAESVRAVEDDERSLADMGVDALAINKPEQLSTRSVGESGWLAVNDRYVVISGCRDNEYSHEFSQDEGGEPIKNGALTHFLIGALTAAVPNSTYRDVFEVARLGVNTRFPSQNPQIEGRLDREIFGVKDIEPLRFVPVQSVTDKGLVLEGGAAHGLQAGAVWEVFKPGTKRSDQAKAIAQIAIDSVGPLTAQASIIDQTDDIAVGARCVELQPADNRYRMTVDLSALGPDERPGLESILAESDLVEIAQDASADLRVYALSARQSASPGDPVPQLATLGAASWVVVNREGEVAMPVHLLAEPQSAKIITSNIETLARYRNALELENPRSSLNVEFNIYRQQDGEWVLANGGDAVLTSGDRIAFEVINNTDESVFVSILDFDVGGEISLLYPPNKDGERVEAGQTFRFGMADRPITLSLGDNVIRQSGVETLKAFITTDAADFTWLQQQGTRSLNNAKQAIWRQFDAAFSGPKTRKASIAEEPDATDWRTINRSFILQRSAT